MSGQRYVYATDPAKYRAEYMNNLALSADIDSMNFEANKVYKATGQLPAMSQMPDTRTMSEIYADEQKLKIGIVKTLEPIAEAQFANMIVEKIYQSPLNGNNKLLIFMAQRGPEVVANLKKLYATKIKGDINDAEVFVQRLEDMYNKNKASLASVESYFNKSGALPERGLNEYEMNGLVEAIEKIEVKINNMPINRLSTRTRNYYNEALLGLISQIQFIFTTIPTNEKLQKIDTRALTVTDTNMTLGNFDSDRYVNHVRELHSIMREELPRVDTLLSLIGQMEKVIVNESPVEFDAVYEKFLGYLPESTTLIRLGDIIRYLDDEWTILVRRGDVPDDGDGISRVLRSPARLVSRVLRPPARLAGVPGTEGTGFSSSVKGSQNVEDLVDRRKGLPLEARKGRGRPKGSGIARPFEDKVDRTRGIQAEPRYISFGRFLINTKKLNDDILSLKRAKGSNIMEFPSTKISKNLSGVIKKIVGGKIPTFNELNELSEEEKDYLHKVASRAEIEDKFSIPAPSKDKQEKDMHNFEVMKGEIMAGNDSKELIKNFKVLILRLSKTGSLPKKDVQDILQELLEMGY